MIWPSKKMNFTFYLLITLLIQILISSLVKIFYPLDLTTSFSEFVIYNRTMYFSLLFVLVAVYISYKANMDLNTIFSGTLIGLILFVMFSVLLLLNYSTVEFPFKSNIARLMSYTFFHLGGLREVFISIFGPEIVLKFFYAFNITFGTHMFGFVIGDLLSFIRRQYAKRIQNSQISIS